MVVRNWIEVMQKSGTYTCTLTFPNACKFLLVLVILCCTLEFDLEFILGTDVQSRSLATNETAQERFPTCTLVSHGVGAR